MEILAGSKELATKMLDGAAEKPHSRDTIAFFRNLDKSWMERTAVITEEDIDKLEGETKKLGPLCWRLGFCICTEAGKVLYAMCVSFKAAIFRTNFQATPTIIIKVRISTVLDSLLFSNIIF